MKYDIETVITVADKEDYLILDKINHANKFYYYVVRLNEFEKPTKNYAVLEESIDNGITFVQKVLDENLFQELMHLFAERFKEKNIPK